ncbi:serine hydrolase domain-containing protein [Actinoplanes sp. NPDC051346]|uniref:serine hydrolase domain-containing protein n=1 Tax=Actinoplanes sp. NPDC051346 TaxID=3155048 RepID=UPI003445EED2
MTALVAAGGLLVGAASPASAGSPTRHAGIQQDLDRLASVDKLPGALASVRSRDGHTRHYTAGVADLETKREMPVDAEIRVGSNTKTFTAVAVLQLVGDGKVDLEAPVDTYLPNLVRGEGIDGRVITVHQLLQHTSGLPNYTDIMGADFFPFQHTYYQPRELLDIALAQKALFAPGAEWRYSNTNYLLAGLIIEKVTGRPLTEVLTDRVIRRSGLRHTYFPAVGEQGFRGRHPRGYFANKPGEPRRDVTVLDPSWSWAAGQLISTNSDLNAFYVALLGGKLLKPEQLRQMRTTIPTHPSKPGTRHGLGLFSRELSCGGVYWGHGGDIPGFETRGGIAPNGRAVHVAVTAIPDSAEAVEAAVDKALCR